MYSSYIHIEEEGFSVYCKMLGIAIILICECSIEIILYQGKTGTSQLYWAIPIFNIFCIFFTFVLFSILLPLTVNTTSTVGVDEVEI